MTIQKRELKTPSFEMVGKPGGMFGFLEALRTHTYLYLSFLHSLFKFLQSCSFPCCSTATVLTVRRLDLNYPNECVLTYRNPYLLAPAPQSLTFSPLLFYRMPLSSFTPLIALEVQGRALCMLSKYSTTEL